MPFVVGIWYGLVCFGMLWACIPVFVGIWYGLELFWDCLGLFGGISYLVCFGLVKLFVLVDGIGSCYGGHGMVWYLVLYCLVVIGLVFGFIGLVDTGLVCI